jgi:hypothetical protein
MYLEKNKDLSVHTQLVAADTTGASTSVNTLNSDGKAHQVILVVSGTGANTVKLEHSDDDSTWSDVGAVVTIEAGEADMVIATNTKRYVRANATEIEESTTVDATILLTGYDNIT